MVLACQNLFLESELITGKHCCQTKEDIRGMTRAEGVIELHALVPDNNSRACYHSKSKRRGKARSLQLALAQVL